MKFIDIVLALTMSVTVSAAVIASESTTQSLHLSKRSPGKGIKLPFQNNGFDAKRLTGNGDDDEDDSPEHETDEVQSQYLQLRQKYEKYKQLEKKSLYQALKRSGGLNPGATWVHLSKEKMDTLLHKPDSSLTQKERVQKAKHNSDLAAYGSYMEAKEKKKQAKRELDDFKKGHGIESESNLKKLTSKFTKN
ncbi:hypothetical protein QVD99_002696 [Batrachochytrium dendrobatidis]|nr:hypothetical protein QVD99_002696 [Batrachochytrium dendrobatidis]